MTTVAVLLTPSSSASMFENKDSDCPLDPLATWNLGNQQITSSGPRMDRLTTVVGKLQDAANTLEGGSSAGSFLQVDGASMAMVDAGSEISHKAACRSSSVDVCHPLELQDSCICLTLEDDPPFRHDIPHFFYHLPFWPGDSCSMV